jgi:hypothetical protein
MTMASSASRKLVDQMGEISVDAMRVDTLRGVGYIGKEAPVELPAQQDGVQTGYPFRSICR